MKDDVVVIARRDRRGDDELLLQAIENYPMPTRPDISEGRLQQLRLRRVSNLDLHNIEGFGAVGADDPLQQFPAFDDLGAAVRPDQPDDLRLGKLEN